MHKIEYSLRPDGLYNKWVYMPTPKSFLDKEERMFAEHINTSYGVWPYRWILTDVVEQN